MMYRFLLLIFLISATATAGNAQKIYSYPVVVSFNSMCCGVPDSGPVIKLLRTFRKQYKIKRIAVDSIGPMGKEGEYNLAFRLKEMTNTQKIKFINQLKKIIPTMDDKGSAEIKLNMTINKADLSPRTGITTLRF